MSVVQSVVDAFILLSLGLCGWAILSLFRLPFAPFIGTIVVIGSLRIAGYSLPDSPYLLPFFVQVLLGMFVGARVNRGTICELKSMITPVLIIVIWALTIFFTMGLIIPQISDFDYYTAMLASSIGGLPEMTIIALATDADVTIVIFVQTIRLIAVLLFFPLIFQYVLKGKRRLDNNDNVEKVDVSSIDQDSKFFKNRSHVVGKINRSIKELEIKTATFKNAILNFFYSDWYLKIGIVLTYFIVALVGGNILMNIGIPAGAMLGSLLFVSILSMSNIRTIEPPAKGLSLIIVGVGIMVSDNITLEAVDAIILSNVLAPALIINLVSILSSFVIAMIIHKRVGWDLQTSFLAASPAGFSVMTAIAINYNKDPIKISLTHFFRLLALKSIVPLVFYYI